MNIAQFIRYLNKTHGWNIEGRYYTDILAWRDWWRGDYMPFHTVKEMQLNGSIKSRDMYRLQMPKRICEDWASLLLNDKTTVSVADKVSADWLLGTDGSQTGGMLGQLNFWQHANELLELAFRSGTGAFVMSAEGLQLLSGAVMGSPEAKLYLDYLPAECILPITIRHGQVVDVAFASEVVVGGKSCIYLQTHKLLDRGYRITNEFFTSQNEDGEDAGYQPAPLPKGMITGFETGSTVPWFSLLRPNIVKNRIGGAGLGVAVFAEALDAIKLCDLAFDNYARDIRLGGKKVFYSRELLKSWVDEKGEQHYAAPDEVRAELFVSPPGGDPDETPDWHEYNPDLRVEANSKAVQDALDYASFRVGLGTHHYQFTGSAVKTATEYTGDRQDMVQHANRHQINVEAALTGILRALLWAGKTLLAAPVDPDTELTINFDDSYITDTGTRRETDRQDVRDGLWPKYRYLMEWRGLSEAEARKAVAEAGEESSGESLGFGES